VGVDERLHARRGERLAAIREPVIEGYAVAATGKAGVELRHLANGEPRAAERHGERRLVLVGKARGHTGAAEAAGEFTRTDACQHPHRRNVHRLLERFADRDRAVVILVEVFRRVAAKADGPVFNQRFGMREARFEGEAVDEGFER